MDKKFWIAYVIHFITHQISTYGIAALFGIHIMAACALAVVPTMLMAIFVTFPLLYGSFEEDS